MVEKTVFQGEFYRADKVLEILNASKTLDNWEFNRRIEEMESMINSLAKYTIFVGDTHEAT